MYMYIYKVMVCFPDDLLIAAVSRLGDMVNSINERLDNRNSAKDLDDRISPNYDQPHQIEDSSERAVDLNNLRPYASLSHGLGKTNVFVCISFCSYIQDCPT